MHGAYQMTLTQGYRLRLPEPWRAAFADRQAVLTLTANHWSLYPVQEHRTWLDDVRRLYEGTGQSMPRDIFDQVNSATAVRLTKAGTLIVPPSLRRLPPGRVEVLGVKTVVEIWPVAAWREEMATSMNALDRLTAQ